MMEESIFSIEVFIHQLNLSKTAIVGKESNLLFLLKFLDFDSQVIQNEAVSAGDHSPMPLGGKSCLFKYNMDLFLRNIARMPLYIILVDKQLSDNEGKAIEMDTSPSLQFIGSSSVALTKLAAELQYELETHGLTLPVVKGHRGYFNIYNLMGETIGEILLSYRVHSLGNLSTRHLPKLNNFMKSSSHKRDTRNSNCNIIDTIENIQKEYVETPSTDDKFMSTPNVAKLTERKEAASGGKVTQTGEQHSVEERMSFVDHSNSNHSLIDKDTQSEGVEQSNAGSNDPPALFYRRTKVSHRQPSSDKQGIVNLQKVENTFEELLFTEKDDHGKCVESKEQLDDINNEDEDYLNNFPVLKALCLELDKVRMVRKPGKSGVVAEHSNKHSLSSKNLMAHGDGVGVKDSVERTKVRDSHNNSDRFGEMSVEGAGLRNKRLCEMKIVNGVPGGKSWIRTNKIPVPIKCTKKLNETQSKSVSKLHYGLTSTYLARLRSSNPSLFQNMSLSLNESQQKLFNMTPLNGKTEETNTKNKSDFKASDDRTNCIIHKHSGKNHTCMARAGDTFLASSKTGNANFIGRKTIERRNGQNISTSGEKPHKKQCKRTKKAALVDSFLKEPIDSTVVVEAEKSSVELDEKHLGEEKEQRIEDFENLGNVRLDLQLIEFEDKDQDNEKISLEDKNSASGVKNTTSPSSPTHLPSSTNPSSKYQSSEPHDSPQNGKFEMKFAEDKYLNDKYESDFDYEDKDSRNADSHTKSQLTNSLESNDSTSLIQPQPPASPKQTANKKRYKKQKQSSTKMSTNDDFIASLILPSEKKGSQSDDSPKRSVSNRLKGDRYNDESSSDSSDYSLGGGPSYKPTFTKTH